VFNPATPTVEKVEVPTVLTYTEQQARDQLTHAISKSR
jgi:hypothetical protein